MRFTKVLKVLLSSLLLPSPGCCVDCGKWYSSDCIADSDIRYDRDASNSLTDQAVVWKRTSGLYRVVLRSFGATGDAIPEVHMDIGPPLRPIPPGPRPYPQNPFLGFFNVTISGSRRFDRRYFIYPPASAEFCNQPIPPRSSNVYPGGICGVNGYAAFTETYATSTYEKDGSARNIGGRASWLSSFFVSDEENLAVPVDETTIYSSVRGNVRFFSETMVCLDSECNRASSTVNVYAILNNNTAQQLVQSTRIEFFRIASQAEFVAEIQRAYETNNVTANLQVEAPMQNECLEGWNASSCPTDEDFCQNGDPECSESLYQEPDATVKAGPIVGIVAAFFVLIVAGILAFYQYKLRKQAERNRSKFARRIAETIRFHSSARQLSPEALVEEFKEIDKASGDGYITKEELWEFLSSGKMGELNESDFEAMFAALDVDKNGKVDFLEFCTFCGQCNEEFDRVKGRQSVIAARRASRDAFSVRGSVAEVAARRLSVSH